MSQYLTENLYRFRERVDARELSIQITRAYLGYRCPFITLINHSI